MTVCKLTQTGKSLKEAGKNMKTESSSRRTLAPVSIEALTLEDTTEIRTDVGVGGFAATVNKGEAWEKKTEFLFTYLEGV